VYKRIRRGIGANSYSEGYFIFAYYPPTVRLDFSDTGELLYILGMGEIGVDAFRERFLAE